MGKVILKVPPFFAFILDPKSSGWFAVETKIADKITIRNLLTEIAANKPEFRQAIFNPAEGILNGHWIPN